MQFIEAASAVRAAPRQKRTIVAAILACKLLVGSIAVGLQDAVISSEMPSHAVTGPATDKAISHHGRSASAKRRVFAGIGLEPGPFRATSAGGKGRQAGFIREDPVAFEDLTQGMVCEYIQLEAHTAHLRGHQPSIKGQAIAGSKAFLPVERQAIHCPAVHCVAMSREERILIPRPVPATLRSEGHFL